MRTDEINRHAALVVQAREAAANWRGYSKLGIGKESAAFFDALADAIEMQMQKIQQLEKGRGL